MKYILLWASIIPALVTSTARAELIFETLLHDGISRGFHLYVPDSYQPDTAAPLLIALHGRTGNGLRMANLTGFNLRAETHGFIAIYPDGLNNQWNYLHGSHAMAARPNDSDFLLRVKSAVEQTYNIDESRVYVTGISNGGFMAQRLACHAPDVFAGFASVAAGGFAEMPIVCAGTAPVNLLVMHGTEDRKIPWRGLGIHDAQGNRQLVTLSIAETMKFWARHNRCSPDVAVSEIVRTGRSPGTQVKIYASSGCLDNTRVVLYAILGGGHNWPGVANFIPADIAGRVNLDIHASDVIWNFFESQNPG